MWTQQIWSRPQLQTEYLPAGAVSRDLNWLLGGYKQPTPAHTITQKATDSDHMKTDEMQQLQKE